MSDPVAEVVCFILGGTFGVIGRTLFTARVKRHEEMEKTARGKRLTFLEKQLAEFYWPLCIRLEKDDAVWSKMLDAHRLDASSHRRAIALNIERKFILPNHKAVVKLVETKIHLAGTGNEDVVAALMAYVRHVAVYQAIFATRKPGEAVHKFPNDYGENYPKGLSKLVRTRAEILQSTYDNLTKHEGMKAPEAPPPVAAKSVSTKSKERST